MSATVTAPVPTRAYRTQVARTEMLTPHFLRVTLTAEDLQHFGPAGGTETAWDQRIKLFLPRPDGSYPEIGLLAEPAPAVMQWYNAWRQLDESERNPIRTYTVRRIRHQQREVDIDFVLHTHEDGSSGPAASWATKARPGDELIIIGPDRRAEEPGGGIDFTPGSARNLLLAGDETAVPAICAILEALPADYTGHAYLEVPTVEDSFQAVETPSEVSITWLPREGAPLGSKLKEAVASWGANWQRRLRAVPDYAPGDQEIPELGDEDLLWEVAQPQEFNDYAWLAGEAGVITGLRRHLVKDLGLSRKQVSFMGYWRQGRPGA